MHARKPVKRETLLPEYSPNPPLPSLQLSVPDIPRVSSPVSSFSPTYTTGLQNGVSRTIRPLVFGSGLDRGTRTSARSWSQDTDASDHGTLPFSPLSPTSQHLVAVAAANASRSNYSAVAGPSRPIQQQQQPAPPSYSSSIKPMLLWLDGGGTRVMTELVLLGDLMHRLAWDLKYTNERPEKLPWGQYYIPPKDCFDWIAGCGCGAIVVYAIAAGIAVPHAREKLVEMAPALREADMHAVERILDSMTPQLTKMISHDGESIFDVYCETNVWMPAAEKVMENPGITIKRGDPLLKMLKPLVLREIRKELEGTAELLDCSVQFLYDVCPVFDECSFFLSLGSGVVPRPTPQVQSWWDWFWSLNALSPSDPQSPQARRPGQPAASPLPPCLPQKRNNIIPPRAHVPPETFVRLDPDLATFNPATQTLDRADDWDTTFSRLTSMAAAYLSKADTARRIERVNTMMKWKEIPPPLKKK